MAIGHGKPVGGVYPFYVPATNIGIDNNYDTTNVLRSPVLTRFQNFGSDHTSLRSTILGCALVLLSSIPIPLPFTNESKNPPSIRKGIAAEIGYIDPTEFWLFAPPLVPFAQSDWTNPLVFKRNEFGFTDASEFWMLDSTTPVKNNWELPQRPRGLIADQLGYTDPTEFWLFAQPFAIYDWPNPLGSKRNEFGSTDASEFWMLDSAIPLNQRDWQNPQRPRQRSEYAGFVDTYKVNLFATPPAPFYLIDWQNPRGPKSLIADQIGYIDPTEYWMLDSFIPVKNSWELPQRPRKVTFDQSPYNVSLLSVTFTQPPFAQSDWPNPLRARGLIADQLGSIDYVIQFFVTSDSPFYVTDWPNPQRPRPRNEFGFSDPSEFWMLNSIIPFAQSDWANPQRPRQRSEYAGFTDQYKVLLFAAPPSPFYLLDWQNPRGPKGLAADQLGFADPTEFWMLNSIIPVAQYNWPNPVLAKPAAVSYGGHQDVYKINLFSLVFIPFYQTDWPNPSRGAKSLTADQLGFTDPTEFWMLNSIYPFSQGDWQNPLRAKQRFFGYDLKLNLTLQPIILAPFSQSDWPNPLRPRPIVSDFIDPYKINLNQVFVPFVQSDWPNPVRSKPVHPWHFDRYKISLTSNPQRQTDWPNPSLGGQRNVGNFGFSVRQQLIPGNFQLPGTGQLLLTTFNPTITQDHTHHWRVTIGLRGDTVPREDLRGNTVTEEDLQGSTDPKRSTEGG